MGERENQKHEKKEKMVALDDAGTPSVASGPRLGAMQSTRHASGVGGAVRSGPPTWAAICH